MNKFKRDEYLVERLWQRRVSNLVTQIQWMRESFAMRNDHDELINKREVAESALRDLRVAILEIVTCDIRWDNYNLRSPFIVARELTEYYKTSSGNKVS